MIIIINRLFQVLLEKSIIEEECYLKLRGQISKEDSLEDILIKNGIIQENILTEILEREFLIKTIDTLSLNIDDKFIELLKKEDVKKYCTIPFGIINDKLCVAMSNPLNMDAIEDIAFITNRKISPYYDKKINIHYAMQNYYGRQLASEALKVLNRTNQKNNMELKSNNSIIEEAPVVKLTDSIITQGINQHASDIHLDPFGNGTIVRFRVDGILKEHIIIPKSIFPSVCTRIKIKSGMDISNKMSPQDGKMIYKYENKELDLRVSSIPTLYGEKITIRILNKSSKKITLDKIIYDNTQKEELIDALNHQGGIILVTGPTGSGKTTTLCALLNHLDYKEKNIITIEDPIEYNIEGINQVNVNNKSGLTFSSGLRNILRQDPDIIMIGEIRDEETAEIAIKAAITGHLVLSTLHTNDSFSSITRLLDMKIPGYLVADSLVTVVSQRLIRRICTSCITSYSPDISEKEAIKLKHVDKFYKGNGCKNCNGSGYKGRIAVLEILKVDDTYRKLIKEMRSSTVLKEYSYKLGMLTLGDKSKELVVNGLTTSEEIKRVFYEFL